MSVRVAMIGCGWWPTTVLLPALERNRDAEIAALVDPDAERLAATARAFEVPAEATFTSTEALLDSATQLDAAIVAVPHALHHPVATLVLERGLHLLLEKPMTIEPAHAHALVELARRKGVELIVDYPYNFNAQALTLQRELAAGRIGPIEHVSMLYASTVRELYRGNPEPYRDTFGYPVNAPATTTYSDPALAGGGQGQTQVTHAIALLLAVTGLQPLELAAFTSDFELPVDLADAVSIRFEGGALGTLTSAGNVLPGQDEVVRCEIFGRDGHVLFDVNRGLAAIHGVDGAVEHLPGLPREQRNPEPIVVGHLVDVVLGRAVNGAPGELGAAAVEFVAALYRSARERRVVALEEL